MRSSKNSSAAGDCAWPAVVARKTPRMASCLVREIIAVHCNDGSGQRVESAQRMEKLPHILHEQCRLFQRCKVTAARHFRPVRERTALAAFDPRARRHIDFLWKEGITHRRCLAC